MVHDLTISALKETNPRTDCDWLGSIRDKFFRAACRSVIASFSQERVSQCPLGPAMQVPFVILSIINVDNTVCPQLFSVIGKAYLNKMFC
jgi:hypothetical protein